jgi:hypothetical protein
MGAPALTQPDAPTFLPDAVPPEALPPEPPVAPDPYGRPNIMPDAVPVAAGDSPMARPDPLGPPAIQPDAQPVAIPEPQPAQPPPAKPVEPSKPAKVTVDQKQEFASPIQDATTPTTPPIVAKSSAKDITPDTTPQVTADKPIAEMAIEKIASAKIPLLASEPKLMKDGSLMVKAADPAVTNTLRVKQAGPDSWIILDGKNRIARAKTKEGAVKYAAKVLNKALPDPRGGEAGAMFGPADDIVKGFEWAKDKALSVFSSGKDIQGSLDELYKAGVQPSKTPGRINIQHAADKTLETFALGQARKLISFPRTMAQKYPAFRPIYDHATNIFSHIARTANQVGNMTKPYFHGISDAQRVQVNSILEADRLAYAKGQAIDTSNVGLAKRGLDPEAIVAYRSVRDGLDLGLDTYGQALKDRAATQLHDPQVKAQFESDVDQFVNDLKGNHYVPFGRFGDHFIRLLDDNGNTQAFKLYESKSEWARDTKAYAKQFKVEADKVRPPTNGAYAEVPVNFMHDFYYRFVNNLPDNALKAEMKQVISDMTRPKGFQSHFVKADLTPGYSKDFRRSIADYVVGLSHFSAQSKYMPLIREAVANIPEKEMPALKAYASKYADNLQKANPKFVSGMQKFMAGYYLSRPMTAGMNLTQVMTTTMPEAWDRLANSGKYRVPGTALTDAGAISVKAGKNALEYWTTKDRLAKRDPELVKALDTAVGDGIVSEQMYRDYVNQKNGTGPDSVLGTMTALFRKTEIFNRTHSTIVGYQIGKKIGLAGKELQAYAEDFTKTTQFDMSSANKPMIAHAGGGVGSLLWTFRPYTGNMIRFWRDGLSTNHWRKAVGNTLALVGMGGVAAAPLASVVIKTAENMGYDPRGALKQMTEGDDDWSKTLKGAAFGLPHLMGFASLGGSLGTGDWVPDVEMNPVVGAGKIIAGPAGALAMEGYKAVDALSSKRYGKAAQAIAPAALKGPLKAMEAYKKDAYTTGRGEHVLDNPTPLELALTSVGATPPRLAEKYVDSRSKQLIKNKITNARGRHNEILGQYIADGDMAGFDEYLNAVIEETVAAAERGDLASIFEPNADEIEKYAAARMSEAGAQAKFLDSLPDVGKAAAIEAGLLD